MAVDFEIRNDLEKRSLVGIDGLNESVVTKKIIKTRYLKEVCGGRSSLSKDEKKELHGLIYSCIQEIQSGSSEPTHQPKGDENAPKERLMEDNSESIKHSHKRDKENTEPAKNSKVKRLSLEDAVRDVMDEATISEPVKKKSRKKSPETAEMDTPALVSSDSHANSKSLGKRFEDRLLSLDAALMEVQKSDPIGGQSDCDTGFNSSDGEFLQTAKLKTRKRKLSGMVVSSDSDGEIGRKNKKKRFIVDVSNDNRNNANFTKIRQPVVRSSRYKHNRRRARRSTVYSSSSDSDASLEIYLIKRSAKKTVRKNKRKKEKKFLKFQIEQYRNIYSLSSSSSASPIRKRSKQKTEAICKENVGLVDEMFCEKSTDSDLHFRSPTPTMKSRRFSSNHLYSTNQILESNIKVVEKHKKRKSLDPVKIFESSSDSLSDVKFRKDSVVEQYVSFHDSTNRSMRDSLYYMYPSISSVCSQSNNKEIDGIGPGDSVKPLSDADFSRSDDEPLIKYKCPLETMFLSNKICQTGKRYIQTTLHDFY